MKFDPENGGSQIANLRTECLLLKEFSHKIKYLPKYFDHSNEEGLRYLVMEYLDSSLSELLA